MINAYLLHLVIMIAIYGILALSLNLALGFTGLLNMAHASLFGIGAYVSALLTLYGVPFLVAFLLAGLLSGIAGCFLVLATRKLKGDYLALATLGFSFVISSVMINWVSLTRGPLGLPGIPSPEVFGFTISNINQYALFSIIVFMISYFLLSLIAYSRFGLLLEATRDDPVRTEVAGKNTFLLKIKSIFISGFFAGLAGSLFAHYMTYIDPTNFALNEIILLFTIVIVGGLASLEGSILATIVLILIPEALRFLHLPSTILGPLRQMIYAVILIIILLFRPKGFFGRVELED